MKLLYLLNYISKRISDSGFSPPYSTEFLSEKKKVNTIHFCEPEHVSWSLRRVLLDEGAYHKVISYTE